MSMRRSIKIIEYYVLVITGDAANFGSCGVIKKDGCPCVGILKPTNLFRKGKFLQGLRCNKRGCQKFISYHLLPEYLKVSRCTRIPVDSVSNRFS